MNPLIANKLPILNAVDNSNDTFLESTSLDVQKYDTVYCSEIYFERILAKSI